MRLSPFPWTDVPIPQGPHPHSSLLGFFLCLPVRHNINTFCWCSPIYLCQTRFNHFKIYIIAIDKNDSKCPAIPVFAVFLLRLFAKVWFFVAIIFGSDILSSSSFSYFPQNSITSPSYNRQSISYPNL